MAPIVRTQRSVG